MPPKPRWLKRVPQIRAAVEASPVPFFDRAAVEQLFRLKRRQAIHLVRNLAGYEVGKSLVAPRETLLAFLRSAELGGDYQGEVLRLRRVREAVEDAERLLAARKVKIQAPAAPRLIKDLPPGIRLAPGQLEVDCDGAQDLLQKLFALSRAIAGDFPAFETLVARPSGGG
jgi:hypothetical protein